MIYRPKRRGFYAGVLVLMEAFGLTPHIDAVTARIAGQRYVLHNVLVRPGLPTLRIATNPSVSERISANGGGHYVGFSFLRQEAVCRPASAVSIRQGPPPLASVRPHDGPAGSNGKLQAETTTTIRIIRALSCLTGCRVARYALASSLMARWERRTSTELAAPSGRGGIAPRVGECGRPTFSSGRSAPLRASLRPPSC
jgi:hypothetical protein